MSASDVDVEDLRVDFVFVLNQAFFVLPKLFLLVDFLQLLLELLLSDLILLRNNVVILVYKGVEVLKLSDFVVE